MSTRKQWTKLTLLTLTVCLFFSRSASAVFISSELSSENPGTVRGIITSYCSTVLKSAPFVENNFVYSGQQSAFVYLLCSNIDKDTSSYFTAPEKYFNRTTFKQLGFQDIVSDGSYSTDLCTPDSFANDCDLATNIPNLFNGIMNDYVNMKQPNLYGMKTNFKDDTEIIPQINIFSSGYFNGVQVCDDQNPLYPQTCKILQGYMKNVRNILADVSILNANGILDISKVKDDKKVSCDSTADPTKDIFYCGLYGDKGASLVSFTNLAYNELFYYRLFMAYYLTMLQQYPELLKGNVSNLSYESVFKTFSSQYTWSKDALSLSLRMMRDTYMAFPFHVGFLMYQEDLDGFGRDLAHIVTPIYTLYDKLRNVQKPQ